MGIRLVYQFTQGFSEYASAFLYASDILLVLFLASQHPYILQFVRMRWKWLWPLWAFLILAAVSVFFAPAPGLALYNLARLLLLVLLALAIGRFPLKNVLAVIASLAVLQSLIGFGQFASQSSLDLRWLGESVLGSEVPGVAKIVVDGAKIIRAYGTFPHPNVLAAFLLLGLFSAYYLALNLSANSEYFTNKRIFVNSKLIRYSLVSVSIFIILLGLTLTFSRTAWAIGGFLTLFFILYHLFSRPNRRATVQLAFVLLASGYTLVAMFSPYIYTRAAISQTEPAFAYRLIYNQMGLDIIKNNPLGVGIGNQVLYAARSQLYEQFGLTEAWQKQPIHNIYILIASEIGILGLLAFLWFLWRTIFSARDGIVIVMLAALLLFGLFDHFLWTLEPGRLMLWLTIGLVLGLNKADKSL